MKKNFVSFNMKNSNTQKVNLYKWYYWHWFLKVVYSTRKSTFIAALVAIGILYLSSFGWTLCSSFWGCRCHVLYIILLGKYMNLHLRIRISPLWMLCSFQWQLSECMFYNWNIQITVWIINKIVNKIVFFIIIKSSGGNSMLRRNYNIPFVSLPGNLLPIFCSGRYSCNSSFCWINCNLPSGRQDTWSQMFPREEYYI